MFCLIFGMVGIPFMLSVLADVGGLMAEGIEYTWLSNRDRFRLLAGKLNIVKQRQVLLLEYKVFTCIYNSAPRSAS